MVYHVLVYNRDSEYMTNELFLHAFIGDMSKLSYVVELARKLVEKYKETDKRYRDVAMRYYGVEHLPVEVGEGWFLFAGTSSKYPHHVELLERGGDVDLRAVEEFKSRRLTVDNDTSSDDWTRTANVLLELKGLRQLKEKGAITGYAFYESRRGFHVRASLAKPTSFDEKVAMRDGLYDDMSRLRYDWMLHELGLAGLADLLFNEKCWLSDAGQWECYSERPLLIKRIHIGGAYHYFRYHELPDIDYPPLLLRVLEDVVEFDAGRLRMSKGVVELASPVAPDDMYCTARELVENPMKLVGAWVGSGVEKAVVSLYCIVSSAACEYLKAMLMRGAARIHGDGRTIVIYLAGPGSTKAGVLIGHKGCVVKIVEELLGRRVKVMAEHAPPEVQQKKRLIEERSRFRNLLTKLVAYDGEPGGKRGEEKG